MRAVVWTGVDEVQVRDVPEPALRPGHVRLRNRHVGICGSDTSIVHGKHPRARPPLVLGHENASLIEAVSPEAAAAGWAPGQAVVVFPLLWCGQCWPCRHGQYQVCHRLRLYGIDTDGFMAQRQVVPADALVRLPEGLPLRLAALVEPLAVAVHTLHKADWSIGPHVLVTGAGPIGMLTALAIRHLKGIDPQVVEVDPIRRRAAERLGFSAVEAASDEAEADLLIEASGAPAVARRMTDLVHACGQIVIESIFKEQPVVDLRAVNFKEIEIRASRCYQREDFGEAIGLLERHGAEFGQVITHDFPLEEAPRAWATLEARGEALKVLIGL